MRLLLLLLLLPNLAFAATADPAPVGEIRTLLRAGDIDAAVDASDRAVKAMSGHARVWWWAGRAYGQKAMRANVLTMARWAGRSREAFEKAVALDPDHLESRFDLLSYYLMAPAIVGGGRDKAALQAGEIAARDAAMGKVAAARLANADKQPEQGEALYREALALDPDNTLARTSLASLAGQRKEWDAVRALWQAQLERERHHALAHYQLGRTAALSGEQVEQGLAHLDAFVAADDKPDELGVPAAQWRRGQLLERLGRRDEALAALQVATSDPAVRALAEPDLARLRAAR